MRRRRRFTTTSFTAARSPRSLYYILCPRRARIFQYLKMFILRFFLTGYILLCLESARARPLSYYEIILFSTRTHVNLNSL